MAFALQLDLFETVDPIDILHKDFRILDKKCQNVQRGLFARFSTLEESVEMLRDICIKQKIEIEELKKKLSYDVSESICIVE